MNYRNAKYVNQNGWIDCEIEHPEFGWIPYTLSPDDEDMTVNNNELLAEMAQRGDVEAYVPPTQQELDAAAAMVARQQRDYLLATEVDPIVTNPLRWADLTTEQQDAWAAYRRALLDITDQAGFPQNIVWPTKPE
jgi:hypothetical protein